MTNVSTGEQVVRSKGDYVVGRVGTVVEIDPIKSRARVKWDGANPTTWVSFSVIEPTSIPYKIEKIPGKYSKYVKV